MAKSTLVIDDTVIPVIPALGSSLGVPAGDVSVATNLSIFIDEEFVVPDGFEILLETNASLVIV